MTKYRNALPQLGGDFFLTDGGIETTLIFHDGLELPDFAAFHLLRDTKGQAALRKYFQSYVEVARRRATNIVLESATWRASRDWGQRLGYDDTALAEANRAAIRLLEELRADFEASTGRKAVISGCVGPRGDGYQPSSVMSAVEAERYHQDQIEVFRTTAADMVTAITMNYVDEAVGVAQASKNAGLPVALSFTVETDGKLPTGQSLRAAVEAVDAATESYPAYYMINCAHPTHFEPALEEGEAWTRRIRGLRANASKKSHTELNESPVLDVGDPGELAQEHAALKRRFPEIRVLGGCCGTDHRHIEQIVVACAG